MNIFRFVPCMVMALGMLASCQQSESADQPSEGKKLGIQASVSNPQLSRTVISGETTSFVDGDRIGFFMPDVDSPTLWTREGGNWSSSSQLFWPDLVSEFVFDAFYPYEEGTVAVRNSIPMPDISRQTGKLDDLGKYDFLVARTSCSYTTSQGGTVSFTGESAFQHKYSLVRLIFKNGNDDDLSLTRLNLDGTDIVSKCTYDMVGNRIQKDEGEPSVNELTVDCGSAVVPESGYTLAVLLNPSTAEAAVSLTLSYVRGEKSYTASTEVTEHFESGKLYQYTVTVQKEGLTIKVGEVADWNTGTVLDDIVIKDESDQP